MPSSSLAHRRDRPRQERRRSSSWSHTYRRKSQVSSSHYSEDDDSAYLSASSASDSSEAEDDHSMERDEHRRCKRGQRAGSSRRKDERRSRKSRHDNEPRSDTRRTGSRERTKKTRDRECNDDEAHYRHDGEDDAAATIARLQKQLAEAQATSAKLEAKAEKQDKAIKFLFKDNDRLKRKLEEKSSRSQGKALRDLCDRNDRLEAENRQLRERYAALAAKVNGGAEHTHNTATTSNGRNGGMGDRVSSGATRSTACSSSVTPESLGARVNSSSPVPPQPSSQLPQRPVATIPHTTSRRRNSMLAGTGTGGEESTLQSPSSQQPPIAALSRTSSSRRRNSMLGSGVREIPTSMLQAPPPEFGHDQHKGKKDFGGLIGGPAGTSTSSHGNDGNGHGEGGDPILGKTFSVNTGPSPSNIADACASESTNKGVVAKKRIGLRRASMFA